MAEAEAPGDGWLFTPGTEPRGSGLALDCDRGGHSMRSREGQRGKDRRMQKEGNKTEGYKGGGGAGQGGQTARQVTGRAAIPRLAWASQAENQEGQAGLQRGGKGLLPGSSGTGRSGGSGGPSLSVFSSVDPAYGSSPFSPWPVGGLCSLCSATLGEPRGGGTA